MLLSKWHMLAQYTGDGAIYHQLQMQPQKVSDYENADIKQRDSGKYRGYPSIFLEGKCLTRGTVCQ